MTIAIEFGDDEFRSLRREGRRLLARRTSVDYLVLDLRESHRRLLERHAEEYASCEEGAIVFGPTAYDFAELLSLPMQSALQQGRLRHGDPVSRQFLSALVEGLLPKVDDGSPICLVLSSLQPEIEEESDDLDFLMRLVKLRGYEPRSISSALGLVFAHCQASGYSGIGLHLGASRVDVSIARQTREIAHESFPIGKYGIDEHLAFDQNSYIRLQDGQEALDTRPVRLWRAGVESLDQITDERLLGLRNRYQHLVSTTLHKIRQVLTPSVLKKLPENLPLVIGGPLAGPAGLEKMFEQQLESTRLPVEIRTLEFAHNVHFGALRGGLLLNELLSAPGKSAA